ncbi:hypothetical protein MUN78_02940 [Leucobacter allii]|uniref:DUF2262 domain-containing protein n=1 Tax=Leucobacter allii TaxID=2932247 RepID=A0ABY4FNL7_9MICO|nr:hypothetical protein [Leucobacter allii]UOQ57809.1 hypothetical protein MUN78_02940 [Leucobacter allii]
MPYEFARIPSEWGVFTRATTTLTDGEVLVHNWYAADVEPELLVRTSDAAEAAALLPVLSAFFEERAAWHRRATDAIVRRFSESEPESAELDEAESDLVLSSVEVQPGGDVLLHFDDSCGQHFMHGHWPAVRFDASGSVMEVTVEA